MRATDPMEEADPMGVLKRVALSKTPAGPLSFVRRKEFYVRPVILAFITGVKCILDLLRVRQMHKEALFVTQEHMANTQRVLDLCLHERLEFLDDLCPQNLSRLFFGNCGRPLFAFGLTRSRPCAAVSRFERFLKDFKISNSFTPRWKTFGWML